MFELQSVWTLWVNRKQEGGSVSLVGKNMEEMFIIK